MATNQSLDQLTAKTTPTTSDVLYILDVEDTSQSAAGSSKSLTIANLQTLYVTNISSATKTLTNTTYDTAGTGNVFKINGTSVTGVTGTGNAVLATGPTLVTPVLGVATATSINAVALTAPATAATLTIANNKTLTANNSLTLAGTDATTITFQGTDTYVGRTTTDTMTNKTLTSPIINNPTIGQNWDGWITASDTWTYASATSFTISGVDRTALFPTGTKLKFTNNSITVYATVASSSFSINTTVNVIANTDFTINNSAITNPFYSTVAIPQGFPASFNYMLTWGGFSVSPTVNYTKFYTIGRVCYVQVYCSANGTSNATTLTISLPIAPANTWAGGINGYGVDNGTVQTTELGSLFTAASTTLSLYVNIAQVGWTNTGNKSANAELFYLI